MLTPFSAVNPVPVVNTSQNEFVLNKTAWILEQNSKKTLPFVSPQKTPPLFQRNCPFYMQNLTTQNGNRFPRQKDYITNTYITSKTKTSYFWICVLTLMDIRCHSCQFWNHACSCVHKYIKHFTKLKQYHNSLYVVALTLFKRQHKEFIFVMVNQ